jgi:Glucose / Sorbosone dehydrogenase
LNFAPDGRLFFVEVNAGRIRVANGMELQSEPMATLAVQQAAESGLLGLALDPEFSKNHFVYAYYSEGDRSDPSRGIRNRVVRFTERDGIAGEMTPILDNLPVSSTGAEDAHQGGALLFGPDGRLYVSVGETGNPAASQDLASLAGKILRVNADGSIPPDNPFPGSPVFAFGFRNPWGMVFHPKTGALFATENGNKAHDEINLVTAGGNYGWPKVDGINDDPKYEDPIWDSGHGRDARNGGDHRVLGGDVPRAGGSAPVLQLQFGQATPHRTRGAQAQPIFRDPGPRKGLPTWNNGRAGRRRLLLVGEPDPAPGSLNRGQAQTGPDANWIAAWRPCSPTIEAGPTQEGQPDSQEQSRARSAAAPRRSSRIWNRRSAKPTPAGTRS